MTKKDLVYGPGYHPYIDEQVMKDIIEKFAKAIDSGMNPLIDTDCINVIDEARTPKIFFTDRIKIR